MLDVKYLFICGKLNFHGNTLNGNDIMSLIAGAAYQFRWHDDT